MQFYHAIFFKATHSQKSYGITKIKMNPAFVKAILKFSISPNNMTSKFAVISKVALLCLNLGMQILECLI